MQDKYGDVCDTLDTLLADAYKQDSSKLLLDNVSAIFEELDGRVQCNLADKRAKVSDQ